MTVSIYFLSNASCLLTYVVVEVGVGDSHPVSTVGDVKKTIEVILSAAEVARKVAVVDPDVGRLIDTNSITVAGINLANLQVAQDDVLLATDVDADTGEGCLRLEIAKYGGTLSELTASSSTDDGLVRRRADAVRARQLARDNDGEGAITLGSLNKSGNRVDSDGLTSGTTSSTTVLSAVTNAAGLLGLALDQLVTRLNGRGDGDGRQKGSENRRQLHDGRGGGNKWEGLGDR